jgi:hypothetical protein
MKNHGLGSGGWESGRRSVSSGFLLILIAAGFAADTVSGSDGPRSAITVRVCDYARVSRATLQGAELTAAKILQKAGVETAWLNCSLDAAGVAPPLACRQAPGPAEIVLRILPRFASGRGLHRGVTLGFSLVPSGNEWGTYASVFFDRVETLAEDGVASPSEILGHATAHEIGHLLLRSNQHSTVGIMRGRWNPEDLRRASRGCLLFTAQQSELMRTEVRARTSIAEVAQAVRSPLRSE